MNNKSKKITTIAMLCAIAYVVVILIKIPVVMFLDYEPKDIILAIGGFIYGPMTALIIGTIVSVVEMVTVSTTGIIGCIMNILASCGFACSAAYIYKKKHTQSGAIIGLVTGVVLMTTLMILWNYLITPLYMGYPRKAVAAMLIPTFLPFNLVKGGINAAVTLLIYKPVVTALRKSGLVEMQHNQSVKTTKAGLIIVSALVLATCIFFILVLQGII